jgi:hypothetical protein
MDFFKALIPGTILTLVVSAIMGAGHTKTGWLQVQHIYLQANHGFYWSWSLFVIGTGLSWMLAVIIPK